MRDLMFRGKTKRDGRWVISDSIRQERGKVYLYDEVKDIDVEVIPETVGQYTGLTDKNGVNIFEGDICRNTKTGEIVSVKWHGTMAGYVWSRQKEGCKHLFDFGELFRCFDKYEIISNIYDNGDLL